MSGIVKSHIYNVYKHFRYNTQVLFRANYLSQLKISITPFFKIQLPVIKAINIYWQRTKWRQNAIFANTACKDIRTTKERWQQSLPSPAMVNVVVIIVAVVIGFFLFKESQYVYICAFLSKIEHLKCRFYEIFHTFNNMQKGNMYLQE